MLFLKKVINYWKNNGTMKSKTDMSRLTVKRKKRSKLKRQESP